MDRLIEYCHTVLMSDRVKAWLKEQLISQLKSYNYDTRVRELKDVVENLNKKGEEIHHKVDEEELRYGREILVDVKKWIERVDQLLFEYETFTKDPYNELAVFDLSKSGGYLPKPGIRYRQSRKAYDITKKANELLQMASTFVDTFSYWSGPPSMAAFFSNLGYESFQSREETMRNIIEELEDPNVRMIGLHGLSGVGKTTLVKQVVKKALEANTLDMVAMASATRNPDIRKIQGQIADMLGVTLNEESDIARAARIQKALKNEKKSTLIVLDDLWEKLDLNMLGIPYDMDNHDVVKNVKEGRSCSADGFKDDKEEKSTRAHSTMESKKHLGASEDTGKTEKTLSRHKGCKVLIISESRQVLSSQMDGKANPIFHMEVLTEKESEMLFKKMAGIRYKNSEFEKLAAQIASKCNGLPMSIITTARALKNQSRSIWENIHQTLEGQNLTGTPEFSTKLSYDHLEDDELKCTFLLCARMGRDALIMDLVKYCIGLGFLQGIYTVRETRNKVYALVAKLKESGLLSDSYSRDQFTMQDIVRNAALSIAYKENHSFTMTKGKIDEWPDKLERYASISFHHCDFIERFPDRINYPRLSVFQVINNDPNLTIPKNFFEGMKELKVLILTGIHLSLSESSISSLEKLRMLCLEKCMLDKELSIIGKLKKLRILSFSGSDIETLPIELKQLEKLQFFDISNCSKLKYIPSGVISNLVCLEELYMRNTLIQWEDEEPTRQSKIDLLFELKYLNQLATLDIQIPNISYLPKNLFFDKLHSYKIVIGDLSGNLETDLKMPEKYVTIRFLAIRLKNCFDIHSLKGIKILFERVENLFLELSSVHEKYNSVLEEHNIVHDIFYRLNLKGFPYLKNLSIVNNSTIQSLIYPKDRQHPEKAFPKLESLYLYNLEKMDKICSCELSKPSFGKLKEIKISLCGELKNVFLISMVSFLTVLETIEVSECNSLKEIVPVERQSNTNEIKLLKFPELRFLKLKSLSQFIGFYPISTIEGGSIPSREGEKEKLFHEKVEISKLERMELSSIPTDIIWSDYSSQRFQKLTHLDVNGCWKLEYLLSFSMAKSLVSLKSLFVSECEKMRSIFPDRSQIEGSIFPKLKNIKLHCMKSLSEIWNSKLPSDSFSKVDTLIIEECDKLVNVFHYKKGTFRSLCNLRVTNCRLMQAIFNILEQVRDVSNLQDVHLEMLPNLEHVWQLNENRGGINLNNLEKIWVQDCESLENIFPFSVAKCLHNLEYLVICHCFELREIVAEGEAANIDNFNFPNLSTIKFSELPRLTSFYPGPGAYELSCPSLNDLSIELCDQLEPFNKETVGAQTKIVHFPEKVMNKLKSMEIESWHVNSPNSYMGKGNHRRDNLEELCLSRLMDTEILYSFLHRNPNLKSLTLNNCFFEEMVLPEKLIEIDNLGVVPKLKSLKLIGLSMLKEIGFDADILLERIEFLILKNCPCMVTVVPSSVSLTHLTNLEVVNCKGLKNLMSPSTATSLGQLNTMKVIKCKSLMEIVGKEGENDGRVVFKQLKSLELVSLKSLECFCSSDSCEFEFPSLEKLVVSACYNMENFSKKVTRPPILQNIYVGHEAEKKRVSWDGDLNATVQKIFKEKKFFEGMGKTNFSEHPELQETWKHGVGPQTSWLYSLTILRLVKCKIQPCAIPSHILPYLKCLKELEVRGCLNIEVIFEMKVVEGTGIGTSTTFQLQKLTLLCLPNLMHVWERNGKGTHNFQKLQAVVIHYCENLQTVFPTAVAKNLKKLDKLEIAVCDGLLQIVGKEEDAAADVTQKFVFPCLNTLDLVDLTELICFYPGSFTLECPVLDQLFVLGCRKLERFESANRKPFFLGLKDISNLEELSLDWEYTLVLRSKLREVTGKLEYLNYIRLLFDVDEVMLGELTDMLQKAPNIKEMIVECCRCLEIFRTQIPKIDEMLTHLKILRLVNVQKLHSIGSEDSPWLNMICEKVRQLHVMECPDLTTLVHSTSAVSFSHVKELYISQCHGLEHLFTSSAAEKLKRLERIEVRDCDSIKEIVVKDETTAGGIKLEWLYRISLDYLSSLECFYSGNDTLQLPSLIQVGIWDCPKMKLFSEGEILVNSSFRGITASYESNAELVFYHDLNSSVKKVFLQQFFKAVDEECFSDNLELQANWRGKVGLQSKLLGCLCNLVILKLDNCTLPYAIPSSILPHLKSLKELKVQDSDKVEVIFDTNDIEILETMPQLKILTLERLSELAHVWEKNSQVALMVRNLQEVVVRDCGNLQTVFPASLAKHIEKLEKLEIESCHKLQGIVEKEEGTEANVTEKFVFPCLETLKLCDLPQLSYFYPHAFTLECPALNELSVKECHELELFQSAHPKVEGEVRGSLSNRLPLISNLKVISNLKELLLDLKHISALSLRFRSEQFVQGLNYLEKIVLFFDNENEIEKPMPIEIILQKAPNLIEMSIKYCNSPDIFLAENLKIGEDEILGQLKILTLWKVSALQSMELEDSSWLKTICEKLHELYVSECPHLTTLVHTVSFSCLKKLFILECADLRYLFTPSAAKSLMNLEEITVKECESVKEIVMAKEGDATLEAIQFEQLNTIVLDSLPSLMCFYSGSATLQLSSLITVRISKCPNMKIFSHGVTYAQSFQGIQMSSDPKEDLLFYQDLNISIKGMFQRQGFFKAFVPKSSDEKRELQAVRHGNITVRLQHKWLCELVTLTLNHCTLPYAIPSDILPHLKSLKELKVQDSDKVEVIFGTNDIEILEITPQLKKLTLERLSELTHVWEKNSQGALMVQNLQEVVVSDCGNLETLFPASLAKNLEKLEKLEIESCYKLQEIFEGEEGTTPNITEKFVFPHLEKLDLNELPQLTYFCRHAFTLECPALNDLSVLDCNELELFQSAHPMGEAEGTSSISINRQPLISHLKVISNLKELSLDWKQITTLSLRFKSEQFVEGLNLENFFLYFNAGEDENPFLPVEILAKTPNLTEMGIIDCNSPEIFLAEYLKISEDGMLGQLKILTLWKVSALQSMESEDSSWLNTICEKLHELYVSECPHLKTLVHTVSFSCLKQLSISECADLQYLFTSSAAKELINLEEITVKECESVKEIVMGIEGDATLEAIQFEQLNTIALDSLPSLMCFYSGSATLQLSSLITVQISKCPNMKIFSHGVTYAQSFQGIQMSSDPEQALLFNQDLNTTTNGMFQWQGFYKAFVPKSSDEKRELEAIRRGNLTVPLQNKWLCDLVTLTLDDCTLSYAIPFDILPHLKRLKELKVQDSDTVQVIFDMNDTEIFESASQLKILTLERLSALTHIWEKNSQGAVMLRNLQELVVCDCENLQTLFPASLAKNLEKLEKLEIESCHELQEIVEKEEGTAANVTEKFVFPHLEKLHLYDLPQITYFCRHAFTLECPILNDLSVVDCNELELFQSAHPMGDGEGSGMSIKRQPLISDLKVISNMEKLRLGWKHIPALSLRCRSEQFVEGLNYLEKISLYFDADENEKPSLPIEMLQKAPNLIEMSIKYCNSPDIFLAGNLKIGEDEMLGQLKILTMYEVSALQSMELEDSSWLKTICERLHELNVSKCLHLITLVDTMSFSCLRELFVSHCPQLQYLFTPSAAKSLANLEEITVKECESMKEIVIAKEGDATWEAIQFEQLNTIVLDSLASLMCFYSGTDTLQLSSLITVRICKCPNMKIFSHGVTYAQSFQGIQMTSSEKDLLFYQDLNLSIKGMFQRREFFKVVVLKNFNQKHILHTITCGDAGVSLQNMWICNWKSLKLNKCTLQCAIPYAILLHLNMLKELEVQDSENIEVIFDTNDTEILETASQLKILTLKRLSKLTGVWEKNSHGHIMVRNLQEVVVSDCGNLQTLFPVSVSRNLMKLQKFEIRSCHKLQEIFEGEEGATEKFVFPCLEKLYLYDLPQITSFCCHTFTLECPALNDLSVMNCNELELFQSAHPMGEAEGSSTSIKRQPLISDLKVISNMKKLRLDWKHIPALCLRFRSEQFAEGLSYLEKMSLYFDADENDKPFLPIEILQKTPNLTEMSIEHCNSPELFLAENLKIGEDRILGQLKILTLREVSALQSIKSDDSTLLNTICEKLHELNVLECPHLTTLVHTMSFSCLEKLSISKCVDLQYLFTSSAAKELRNLKEIAVKGCESVKEIVAKERDEDEHKGKVEDRYENGMIFQKLEILTLDTLPKFESFYSGSSTLNLPSLKEVGFTQCYSTKLFRLGDKMPTILKVTIDGVDWEGDINSVIYQQFEEEAA